MSLNTLRKRQGQSEHGTDCKSFSCALRLRCQVEALYYLLLSSHSISSALISTHFVYAWGRWSPASMQQAQVYSLFHKNVFLVRGTIACHSITSLTRRLDCSQTSLLVNSQSYTLLNWGCHAKSMHLIQEILAWAHTFQTRASSLDPSSRLWGSRTYLIHL